MLEYKVHIMDDEQNLEYILNYWAKRGWRFNSMESEYRTNIIIFERGVKNDESENGEADPAETTAHSTTT